MATPLTPSLQKILPNAPGIQRFVYEIPSVLNGTTSPRYELNVQSPQGKIEQIRIAYPTETTTQVFIFSADAATRLTIEEILRTPEFDCYFPQANLGVWFENTDPAPAEETSFGTPNLYIEIDNNGASATGVITVELIIQTLGAY